MPTITKFDSATCKLLAREIADAIAAVAARHGLTAEPAGGTYSDIEYTAKVKFKVTDDGAVAAKLKEDFDQYCGWYGLAPDDYGRVFQHGGQDYMLTGFLPNRAKPIKATRLGGSHATVIFAPGIVPIIKKGIAA